MTEGYCIYCKHFRESSELSERGWCRLRKRYVWHWSTCSKFELARPDKEEVERILKELREF